MSVSDLALLLQFVYSGNFSFSLMIVGVLKIVFKQVLLALEFGDFLGRKKLYSTATSVDVS